MPRYTSPTKFSSALDACAAPQGHCRVRHGAAHGAGSVPGRGGTGSRGTRRACAPPPRLREYTRTYTHARIRSAVAQPAAEGTDTRASTASGGTDGTQGGHAPGVRHARLSLPYRFAGRSSVYLPTQLRHSSARRAECSGGARVEPSGRLWRYSSTQEYSGEHSRVLEFSGYSSTLRWWQRASMRTR